VQDEESKGRKKVFPTLDILGPIFVVQTYNTVDGFL